MSDFEELSEAMLIKLETLNNITEDITNDVTLTNHMESILQTLNANISMLDQNMVENITLSDKADVDLAEILMGKLNSTVQNILISLDFLQDVTTSISTISTTSEGKSVSLSL